MKEQRVGPVVGLGTWNTIGVDTGRAHDVVGAALASVRNARSWNA